MEAKERQIKQGDDGDFLFVIELGKLECHIKNTDDNGEMMVKTVEADDALGELLTQLYNCPPAASVEAAERSTPWKLDRGSFNSIVEDAAQNKARPLRCLRERGGPAQALERNGTGVESYLLQRTCTPD